MRISVLTVALLAAAPGAVAQPSGVGSPIQQIPPAPAPPRSIPDIRLEPSRPPQVPQAPGPRVVVKRLHVTGATRFSEGELIAAAGFRAGGEHDLAGLRAMAARISDFYDRHGYFVAQAYLPAQSIEDGAVTIAVIEGRYGNIGLDNQARVSDRLVRGRLAGLDAGDLVAAGPVQRRLLLLSDLPGVAVRSTLKPGTAVGTSDLLVELRPGRLVTGSLEADNAGNRYTGVYRGGGSLNLNGPFGLGDVASLRVLTAGSGLNYVRGSYQAQVGEATVGVAYAHLAYRLGREFKPLEASGTVDIASLYASYPLIRSHDANLNVLAAFDAKTFRDEVRATSAVTDRTARVATLGLAGDRRDGLWGGGWTSYSVYGGGGDLDIETPAARAADALTARTHGRFGKVSFDVSRLQRLGRSPISLYGEARGQLASKNLDSSEKMELGGAYGVRAYPEGEAYGDQGYLLTAEARWRLARLSEALGGQVQAVAFADAGSITINRRPWAAGTNRRTLGAAGVGLSWADAHNLLVKVSYAVQLGGEPALSAPDRSGRVWVQISKFF